MGRGSRFSSTSLPPLRAPPLPIFQIPQQERQGKPRNGQWDEGSHPLGAAGTLCVRSEHPEITLESTNIKYLQDQGMAGIGRDPKLLSLPLPWTGIIPIIPGLSYPKALMKYPSEQKRFF